MKPILFTIAAAMVIGPLFLPPSTAPAQSQERDRIEQPIVEPAAQPEQCDCPNGGVCNCDPCLCEKPETNSPIIPESSPYGARGTPTETMTSRGHVYGFGTDGIWHHIGPAPVQAATTSYQPSVTYQAPQVQGEWRTICNGRSCQRVWVQTGR